jgi:hypothetical protein
MQVAPQQVTPGENFQIFYFLRNHTDATTYYIQAIIYDVADGSELLTVPLTQSPINARLFTATVNAPGDQAGYGRNIVAISTVYTDSGYSVKSENYEESEQYFLVKAPSFAGGGGGTDYRIVREILQEELKKAVDGLPKPEKAHEPKEADLTFVDRILGAIGALQREVNRVPKEAADLSEVKGQLVALSGQLSARPQFERTDLSALAEAVQKTLTTLETAAKELKLGNAQVVQVFEAALKNFAQTFGNEIGQKIDDAVANQEITMPLSFAPRGPRKPKEEAPAVGIEHLMR